MEKTLNIRKRSIAVIAVIAMIAVIATWYLVRINVEPKIVSLDSNYIAYSNVDKLDNASEMIIIGEATKPFEDREHVIKQFDDGNIQDFYTLTDFKIHKIIKKSADAQVVEGDTLPIIEPISYTNGLEGKTIITSDGYKQIESGNKYIVFLGKNTEGQYGVINNELGKFDINNPEPSKQIQSEDPYTSFRNSVLNKYKNELNWY